MMVDYNDKQFKSVSAGDLDLETPEEKEEMKSLEIIKNELQKIIVNIDNGNSNLSEDELVEVVDFLKMYTNKDVLMSKYQAFNYIHVSRATFDNLVKAGKIPQGIKQQGFTEKAWLKKDLDNYIKNKN